MAARKVGLQGKSKALIERILMEFIEKSKYKDLTGIYSIENKINGMTYVGQTTVPFENRFYNHVTELRHPRKRENSSLVKDFKDYGEENFCFKVLEVIPSEETDKINSREMHWISYYTSQHKAYNVKIGGNNAQSARIKNHNNRIGKKSSLETRKKISETHKSMQYPLSEGLTEELIMNMKKDLMNGMSAADVGRKYNVKYSIPIFILSKNQYPLIKPEGWDEFQKKYKIKKHLTKDDAEKIRELRTNGYSTKELAKMFNCSPTTICNVVAYRTTTYN